LPAAVAVPFFRHHLTDYVARLHGGIAFPAGITTGDVQVVTVIRHDETVSSNGLFISKEHNVSFSQLLRLYRFDPQEVAVANCRLHTVASRDKSQSHAGGHTFLPQREEQLSVLYAFSHRTPGFA
jgi:hypothetical protein